MRFGEAVAITWDGVNFKAHTISINKTSVELHGSPIIQNKTKTDAGVRTMHISDNQIKVLKGFKNSYDKETQL